MRPINTKFITLLVLVSAILPGCQKFLEEDLQGERSDQQFYKTANDAELALTGIYNVLTFANSDNRIWVFGDVASDEGSVTIKYNENLLLNPPPGLNQLMDIKQLEVAY